MKKNSAFQMNGFPQHDGVSPLKDDVPPRHTTHKTKNPDIPTKEKVSIFAKEIGRDLTKAAAVTVVGRMFDKKKKESVRIIGKDWKIT